MKMPTEVKKSRRHPLSKPPMRSPLSILRQDPTSDKGVYLSLHIYLTLSVFYCQLFYFKFNTACMESFYELPTYKNLINAFIPPSG